MRAGGAIMSLDEVAREFARRPGYRLINCRQVAMPVYRLNLQVLSMLHTEVPIIPRFVLRAISLGLTTESDIAGILGLEPQYVEDALGELLHNQDIKVQVHDSLPDEFLLTAQGRDTLATYMRFVPEERHELVYMDSLTRRLYSPETELLRSQEVKNNAITQIPRFDKQIPTPEELRPRMGAFLRDNNWKHLTAKRDFINVVSVDGVAHVYRDDAYLLVFRSETSDDMQLGLIIDGYRDELAETELTVCSKACDMELTPRSLSDHRPQLENLFGSDILAACVSNEEWDGMREAAEGAARQMEVLRVQATTAESAVARTVLERYLDEVTEEATSIQTDLGTQLVHPVEVYEHRTLLRQALENASQRVFIQASWVRRAVVDDGFVRDIRLAAERGVQVTICIADPRFDRRAQDRDKKALKALRDAASTLENVQLFNATIQGDLYVLICDDSFVVATGFPWLSHRGDPLAPYRDERGLFVGIPEEVERTCQFLLEQIQGRCHRASD